MDYGIYLLLGGGAAAIAALWGLLAWYGAAPNVARRATRDEAEVEVATTLETREGQHCYVTLNARFQGVPENLELLVNALRRAERRRSEALVAPAVEQQAQQWARGQDPARVTGLAVQTPPELVAAVAAQLRPVGLELHELKVRSAVVLTAEMQRLRGYWFGECFLDKPSGMVRTCNALDLYLDAIAQAPRWYVKSVPRNGGMVRTLRSAELLADPTRCGHRCFVGKPSGMVRRLSFQDMMADSAPSA